MKETKKTNLIRDESFFLRYLSGKTIDIGCGDDPVSVSVERFDISDGDANYITQYRRPDSYDTVISSHCLEHMVDVRFALFEWWALVRSGGYLIIVVPDEDLYEQGFWPSIFNPDHKASFRIHSGTSWSPVSYNIVELVTSLPDAHLVSVAKQDFGYEYDLVSFRLRDRPLLRKCLFQVARTLMACGHFGLAATRSLYRLAHRFGCPVDQTTCGALAQFEVIVQKATCPLSIRH